MPITSETAPGSARVSAAALAAILLAVSLAASADLAAQDPEAGQGSRIAGRIDGEAVTWRIPSDESIRAATYTNVVPGVDRITIHAYRDEGHAREGSLSIELFSRQKSVRVTEILYFPFAASHPRFTYTDEYGEVGFNIDRLELGVERGLVAGSLSAELYYHQSPRTQPIPHRTTSIELELDLEIIRH